MLKKKCESLGITLSGNESKLEISKLLNNYFKMELFCEDRHDGGVQIKVSSKAMIVVNKAEFRNRRKPDNSIVICRNCRKEYPKSKFRTITGRILNNCIYCRRENNNLR